MTEDGPTLAPRVSMHWPMPRAIVARLSETLRSSLWLVPGTTAVALVVLAKALPALEDRMDQQRSSAWSIESMIF